MTGSFPQDRLLSRLARPLAPARVRVVYTDLDGTMLGRGGSFFLGPDGDPTLEPAEALLAARAAGVDVVPTSGRALRGLLADARLLGLETIIAEMGCLIAYRLGQEVVHNFGPAPVEEGEMPAETMRRLGAVDLLLDQYRDTLEFHSPWNRWRECTDLLRGLVNLDDANGLLRGAGFDWLVLEDNGMLLRPVLSVPPGEAHVYHLMPRGVSKAGAVALDRVRRGIARDECIALGDAPADLSLAEETSALVLMRDAVERDPALAGAAFERPNVYVSDRPLNLGWVDALRALLAG